MWAGTGRAHPVDLLSRSRRSADNQRNNQRNNQLEKRAWEARRKSGSGPSDQLETNDPVDASYALQHTIIPKFV